MARRVFLPFPYADLDRGEWSAWAIERNFEFLANLIDGSSTSSSSTNGPSKVQNLKSDIVSAASTLTLTADSITTRRPQNGSIFTFNAPSLTLDLTTQGVNGRDQVGNFGPNIWVYIYAITDGLSLKTIGSSAAPTTGPTLPTSYIAWAYLMTLRIGAVANQWYTVAYQRGSRYSYGNLGFGTLLAGGSAGAFTPLSYATLVAPNATTYQLRTVVNGVPDGGGNSNITCDLSLDGTNIVEFDGLAFGGILTSATMIYPSAPQFPTIASQQLWYKRGLGSGSGTVDINVGSFNVPNGDAA